jgi:hypothetical protein
MSETPKTMLPESWKQDAGNVLTPKLASHLRAAVGAIINKDAMGEKRTDSDELALAYAKSVYYAASVQAPERIKKADRETIANLLVI